MRTVLIDDDSISLFLMEKLMERDKFSDQITSFQSPEAALLYLQQSIPDHVPEVVLLDLNMPIMSGWDFLEALRPYETQLAGRCWIYILTSSLAPTDKIKAREYSLVAELLHKPLDRAKMQAIRMRVAKD